MEKDVARVNPCLGVHCEVSEQGGHDEDLPGMKLSQNTTEVENTAHLPPTLPLTHHHTLSTLHTTFNPHTLSTHHTTFNCRLKLHNSSSKHNHDHIPQLQNFSANNSFMDLLDKSTTRELTTCDTNVKLVEQLPCQDNAITTSPDYHYVQGILSNQTDRITIKMSLQQTLKPLKSSQSTLPERTFIAHRSTKQLPLQSIFTPSPQKIFTPSQSQLNFTPPLQHHLT